MALYSLDTGVLLVVVVMAGTWLTHSTWQARSTQHWLATQLTPKAIIDYIGDVHLRGCLRWHN